MVLLDLLSTIGGLLRVKETSNIDNAVFKLHYRITTSMLFGFCILVTARGLIGDPILCAHSKNDGLRDDIVNTYCWIHTTFTLPKYYHKPMPNNGPIPYPGIGADAEGDERIYHAYYQWVPFVLFLQGIFFYGPHWLWKAWEGRRLDAMVMDLSNPVISHDERKEKIRLLSDYLEGSLHRHNFYAFKFFICEFLNFANVIFNIWFLNKFFGGLFFSIGLDVLDYINKNQEERTDPLIILFPRVTKCTFRKIGVSGTPEKIDSLCFLALNILNEKIYLFIWFWFIFLTTISALGLVYRTVIYCMPIIRIGLLHKKARVKFKDANKVFMRHLQTGDCFMLHLLSRNIDFLAFNMLMEEMYTRLSSRNISNPNIEMSIHIPPSEENCGLMNTRS